MNISVCQQRAEKYFEQMRKIRIENCISCNEFVGYANQLSMILKAMGDEVEIQN